MNIKFNLKNNNRIIYLIIAFSPLIDIIYTINTKFLGIEFPIQQIIRAMIVGFLFFNLKNKNNIWKIVGLTSILLLGQIYIILNKYDYNLMSNFSYILKILNLFCVVMYIIENLNTSFINVKNIIKSIKIASLILSINIIISNVFKIGLKTYNYGDRLGYKGFIEAHNDVTIVLLMILPIIIYEFLKCKKLQDFALVITVTISLLLIGPKAGKALLILEIVVVFMSYIIKAKKKNYTKQILIFFSIMATLFICTNFSSIMNILEDYSKDKGYRSLYSYIVSYRDIQPRLIDNAISGDFDVHPKYLFGMGYFYANKELNIEKKEFFSIENDFEGLIYYSGLLTATIIIYLIFNYIVKLIKNKNVNKQFKFYISISLFIGIIHSFLGGHVIYSAISNTYFAIILGLGCYSYTDIEKEVYKLEVNDGSKSCDNIS
ncbi:Uncharacterised protein [Clostridium tertium]|uniref:O-Antigen ligase n=1 Tax=Clostridium tertium TaxID=1559 RepID=A0A6N3DNI3_9CLOT